MLYTYHLVALRDVSRPTAAAFGDFVRNSARPDAAAAGGECLGLFLPQLGFSAHERALLFRWQGEPTDVVSGCPLVRGISTDRLCATLRPADSDAPRPGGIFVHRWFTIDPADRAEFLELSKAAWGGFEREFDGRAFGLFAAEPKTEDGASERMLLMTRYGGHADWETSRQQSAEVAAKFARRHALTRASRACSTVLAPI